jgi:ketosteroid isomerase-like protein
MSRVLGWLIALTPFALHAQETSLDLRNADVAAVAQLATDFTHDLAAGDFDRLADFYSPQAVYIAEGEPPIDHHVGNAVAKRWRKIVGPSLARIVVHVDDVDVCGDLAYDRVTYTVTVTQRMSGPYAGRETITEIKHTVRSLDILRKEDGIWKYYRVLTNSSLGDE